MNQTTSAGMFHSTSPEGDTLQLKGVFALDVHQNAHKMEANQKQMRIDPVHSVFLKFAASYVLVVTQLQSSSSSLEHVGVIHTRKLALV